jgi:hypothetical protein
MIKSLTLKNDFKKCVGGVAMARLIAISLTYVRTAIQA